MKYLRLPLCLAVVTLFSSPALFAQSYDSETATIQKKGANTAKVVIDKKSFTAPICFADGASWDNVKDHYEISSSTATSLEKGTSCISVKSDGGVSFCATKCSMRSKK